MGHAGADTLNVRDILVTEPHRVWFASRALLRGPLLRSCGQRRACERETEKRKGQAEQTLARENEPGSDRRAVLTGNLIRLASR